MWKNKKLSFSTFTILLVSFIVVAWFTVYFSSSIETWVVDAETGKPIEGVVTVAHWELEGWHGATGQLLVMEAITDENGHFYFPWWIRLYFPLRGHLVNHDPRLLLFKNGYEHKELQNWPYSNYNRTPFRHSDWNGKTVKMEKVSGDLTRKIEDFASFNRSLHSILRHDGDECLWKKFPKTLKVIKKQDSIFDSSGYKSLPQHWLYFSLVEDLKLNEKYFRDKGCGSVEEFLRATNINEGAVSEQESIVYTNLDNYFNPEFNTVL